MECERLPLILKNNGNCLFCQLPSKSQDNSITPLLHSLQVKQVYMEAKFVGLVGGSEPVQTILVDLQGLEIKAGLCTECSNLNMEFHSLKQKLEACLGSIKAKVKVGNEKDCGGMKYPNIEGSIARETLKRLNMKEPQVLLQDLSVRSIGFGERNEIDVDSSTVNVAGPSSIPHISDDLEGSSFTQSEKGKRRSETFTAPVFSSNDQIVPEKKRPRTSIRLNSQPRSWEMATTNIEHPLSIGRSATASPATEVGRELEDSDREPEPSPTYVASAEPSTSKTAVEEVKGSEERAADIFNSTCKQELLLNIPTYPATSILSYLFSSEFPLSEPVEELPSCYLEEECFIFKTNEAIQKFLEKNANISPEVNPFPGNSVRVYFYDKRLHKELEKETGMNSREITDLQRTAFFNRFLANVQRLFEKFGRHIYNLQIKRSKLQLKKEYNFEKLFGDILHLLKNLKEFEMSTNCPNTDTCCCNSNLLDLPPDMELPLEYIAFHRCCDDSISKAIFNRYGHQLRKLVMAISLDSSEQLLSQPLTQLQELTIFYSDVYVIPRLMRCAFPNLTKLALKLCHDGYDSPKIFLPLLRKFPNLKYFEIQPDTETNMSLECEGGNPRGEVPGLEFFVYPFLDKLNYDFLIKFPNLKQIRFLARVHFDYKVDGNKSTIFLDIREKILTNKMYECNIWDKLPKLNRVCIDWEGDVKEFNSYEYDRRQQLLREGHDLFGKKRIPIRKGKCWWEEFS